MWSDSHIDGQDAGPAARGAFDLEELSDLIGQIYDCAVDPAGWERTIAAIADRFSYDSGLLAVLRLRDQMQELKVHYRMDDAWIAMGSHYLEDSIRLWGGPARIQSFPLDEPIVASAIRPVAEWKNFAYWRDIIAPRGVIDATVIGVARQPDLVGYLGLNRHASNGPVRAEELEGLRLIAPHLRRAVTIGNLFDLQTLETGTFRSVLDGMASAVVLVDDDLRIVQANAAADTMLASGALISAEQGRLSVRGRFAQDALRAAVQVATRNEVALGQRGIGIPSTADDGATAVLHLLPLTRGAVRPGLSPRAVAAVFAVAEGAHTPVDGIAALYDLTPAESQIFASLCRGVSLEETAAALGIAKSTSRTHLLRVFAKTGCSRQAELVALAARLSFTL